MWSGASNDSRNRAKDKTTKIYERIPPQHILPSPDYANLGPSAARERKLIREGVADSSNNNDSHAISFASSSVAAGKDAFKNSSFPSFNIDDDLWTLKPGITKEKLAKQLQEMLKDAENLSNEMFSVNDGLDEGTLAHYQSIGHAANMVTKQITEQLTNLSDDMNLEQLAQNEKIIIPDQANNILAESLQKLSINKENRKDGNRKLAYDLFCDDVCSSDLLAINHLIEVHIRLQKNVKNARISLSSKFGV